MKRIELRSERRLTKCSFLSARHIVARLRWAWEQHVLFTEESRFIFDRKDERQRLRRLAVENLDDGVHKTTRGGGDSVIVWAGVHYGGKTPRTETSLIPQNLQKLADALKSSTH